LAGGRFANDGRLLFGKLLYFIAILDLIDEDLGRLETGDIVLIDHDGKNVAIIVGVGGFLGIGEKDVAVPFDAVRFKKKDNNSWYPVMNTTKDAFQNAQGYKYDRNAMNWMPENAPANIGGPNPAPQAKAR